jgi:L-rhamnose isomerase
MFSRLDGLAVEVPSWAYGGSGTRFEVFTQPGVPRNPVEKPADAARVPALTSSAPAVVLHIPWDEVTDFGELRTRAEELGIGSGTIDSNTFLDDIYKLGGAWPAGEHEPRPIPSRPSPARPAADAPTGCPHPTAPIRPTSTNEEPT